MAVMDKAGLFFRLRELHLQGRTWNEIAHVLAEEGYEEKGEPLTANALRKRFAKWSKTDSADVPNPKSEQGAALPSLASESALTSSISSLLSQNGQLLEQILQSHRLIEGLTDRLEELKSRTSPGLEDTGLVTSRDLLELLRDLGAGRLPQMYYIEEQKEYYLTRQEVREFVEDLVSDRVDAELKTMLEGDPVKLLISRVLEERLRLYTQGITVKESHSGPGRGNRGRTHKKFSASLPEDLFEEVKTLPGMFSAHLDAALRLYLNMMRGN